MKSELPDIDFEGIMVTPKNGYYLCPYNCHDPRYPRKKWYTQRGFKVHMENCPKCPSVIEKQNEIKMARDEKYEAEKKIALLECRYKVGDEVWYVKSTVTKPTHVLRNERLVRIRYEEERSFTPCKSTIKSIGYAGYIIFNDGEFSIHDICKNEKDANETAEHMYLKHLEHLEFSSRCR